MKQRPDKQLLLRYLMGEMTDEDQHRLEVSYLADQRLLEELLVTEDELIESYVRDEFSEHERKRIEKHFLRSRARRETAMFIRALIKYCSDARREIFLSQSH